MHIWFYLLRNNPFHIYQINPVFKINSTPLLSKETNLSSDEEEENSSISKKSTTTTECNKVAC